MLFNTLTFIGFFSLVLPIYWALPGRRLRMAWLLLASIYFYMSWNPWLIGLVLFSASVDYLAALQMERVQTLWKRRFLLIGSIGTNLALLAFFKYVNFFLSSVYAIEGAFGGDPSQRFLEVVLPLGISFYTFETISYIVDVYRGRTQPVRDPLEYALFILFFPHLVAGPIVRPRDFLPQLRREHCFNWDRLQLGLQFFLIGLFKKAVLADNLVTIIDPFFSAPATYGSVASWVAVLGYSAQIYLDFSGYSDMAVGLAHMLGYRLPRNFNMPYLASNITEFWRRWHISLSTWLRDYLFIPLGGSRASTGQTCRNLLVTMLLGGLWHGASWTFVAWGALHGLLLVAHKLMPNWSWRASAVFRPVAMMSTLLAVCVGWVFFRAQSFGDAGTILSHLFWPTEGSVLAPSQIWMVGAVVAVVVMGHLVGALANVARWERTLPELAMGAGLTVLLLLILLLSPENGNAFIYFQF
jgi:alginate O-acetyltransferase complex protein AlgI